MRRKPTPHLPRPPASLAAAALVAALVAALLSAATAPAAASGPGRSVLPRHMPSCAGGTGHAVFAQPCAHGPGALSATHGAPRAHPVTGRQLAAASGSVAASAAQLPALGAALAGAGLVLLGLARHIRKTR
ncbi:hypothetical protein [Streptomyces iconiensis]|uniref:Uncharacterized protein n=1 Tax=Streptomyces iconiensis TaxID=1384038 RepID=A0ABT6ZTI6_9ACTN|nr:hypothetical protein [Streptomyces iconiensis]MDJ1131951.1 hypothetical protein [Streptomyces iconiensis]